MLKKEKNFHKKSNGAPMLKSPVRNFKTTENASRR